MRMIVLGLMTGALLAMFWKWPTVMDERLREAYLAGQAEGERNCSQSHQRGAIEEGAPPLRW